MSALQPLSTDVGSGESELPRNSEMHTSLRSDNSELLEADSIRLKSLSDDAEFTCQTGQTVLEAALQAGLPFAHACGGKARCSTCRIWITEGDALFPEPGELESALKDRLGLGKTIRLACQFRPGSSVVFRRLVIDRDDMAVANQLDRKRPAKAGEIGNVAVLFFDIADFTAMSARLPPYDVMFLLNKLLTGVKQILQKHGGYFDKAIGDGFMAIFGARKEADIALNAVTAALRILRYVDAAKPTMLELYGCDFDARIGLHYGEALIGTLGPAGEERLTVVGDVANIASRVESANKEAGTRLLITEQLFDEVRDYVIAPDFVRMRIQGMEGRQTFYEISGISDHGKKRLKESILSADLYSMKQTWVRLLDSADLGEGVVRVVPQARFDVALVRQSGRVFAFNNSCPHNRLSFFGNELPEGGPLPATPACSVFPEPGRIACRFHGTVFDLETGNIQSWCPKLGPDGTAPGLEILGDISKNEHPLEVYQCREMDGGIWVELE